MNAFFAQAEKVKHIARPYADPLFAERAVSATTTLPLTVPGWDVTKDQGTQLIDAAQANDGNGLEIKLGGDPINRAESQASPEGIGFFGAAIVLLIAFGSVVAAGLPLAIALVGLGISSAGLIPLLANVDRRPRLDHRRLGPDRDRRRHRLLAARPDPFPVGDAAKARTGTTQSSRRSPRPGAA